MRALVACLVAIGTLPAQEVSSSLGIGAARVAFDEQAPFTSTTLTPSLSLRAAAAQLSLSGTFAQVGSAGWSTQGGINAALFSPVSSRGLMLEGAGSFGGSSFPGGVSTAQGLGAARLHWLRGATSSWIGASAGSMFDGLERRGVRQAEVGVTRASSRERFTLLVSPSVTDDTLRYTDYLAVVSTAVSAVDASLSIGGRSGATLPIIGGDRKLWGGAQLLLWLRPRAALVVGAGTYPVDVTQGFPAGQYLSLGLRLGERRSRASERQALARQSRRDARARGIDDFTVRVADDGTLAVRVRAASAQRVELASDLTRWAPVALTRGSDGWWWLRLPHGDARVVELALRVDGGEWMAPPGTELVRDEFGGVSGRLVVDQRM